MSLINTLGWTLLHFLWQGALIALLLAVANSSLRHRSARSRYAAACAALLLMLVCAVATFGRLTLVSAAVSNSAAASPQLQAEASGNIAAPAGAGAVSSSLSLFSRLLPWLTYFWMIGVCLLAARSLGGWITLRRFTRRNSRPADAAWQARMTALARRLKVSRPVRLCESAIAEVPAVIGWIKPIVLLPATAISGLSPEQIEGLLAHELAHIRRHDYLVNLLQTFVETLLFYHPAVWWVSACIRSERENCCDDLAVEISGDALAYARALTQMEQLRCAVPRLAMAANRGSLIQRIQRLLPARPATRSTSAGWLSGAALALLLAAFWISPRMARSEQQQNPAATPPAPTGGVIAPRSLARASVPELRNAPAAGVIAPRSLSHVPDLRLAPASAPSENGPVTVPSMTPVASVTPASQAAGQPSQSSFMDEMNQAGYHDLTTDQLIALKIHGVTSDYVHQLNAQGLKPGIDQLLALRIHGVTSEYVAKMKNKGWTLNIDQLVAFRIHGVDQAELDRMAALGYKLNADQALAMRIHGLTADTAQKIKTMGLGDPSFDQLLAMKIHGADADFAAGMKQAGLGGLNIDQLIALRIHGADPAQVREFQALGFKDLKADEVIAARIHGLSPEFIRDARKRGFKDLSLQQYIKMKQFGLLDDSK